MIHAATEADLSSTRIWTVNVFTFITHHRTGGAAGAASVFFSMPLDCVKTVLDTRGTQTAGGARTLARFWRTGRAMVSADGPGALFRGLVPNLVSRLI